MSWSPAGARFRVQFWKLVTTTAILSIGHVVLAGSGGSATDLQGKSVDPVKQAAGKPVILIFVRTDCPVSNRYAPAIQKLQAAYSTRVDFWLIYPDKDESPAAIEKHLREYGYTIPALRDPGHILVARSQARVTPEAAVFDGRGDLIYHGRIDDWYIAFGHARSAPTTHEAEDAMEAALAGRKPLVATADGVGCYISDLK